MHCSRRRLLRRGLEFHVCTINKSAHTKKVWKLIVGTSYILMSMIGWLVDCVLWHIKHYGLYNAKSSIYIYIYIYQIYMICKHILYIAHLTSHRPFTYTRENGFKCFNQTEVKYEIIILDKQVSVMISHCYNVNDVLLLKALF